MSPGNAEVVQRVMRRFADQDIEAALEDIDPGAVLDWSNSNAPDGGIYIGHAAWRDFAHASGEALDQRRFDSTEFMVPVSTHIVVVVGRIREQGRADGAEVEALASVWTLREGKVTTLTLFQSRAEALKAVRLKTRRSHRDA